MGEIRTVAALRRKRDEIAASVRLYERQREQAKADGSSAMSWPPSAFFKVGGDPKDAMRDMDLHRLFRRGQTWAICREAPAAKGRTPTYVANDIKGVVSLLDTPSEFGRGNR
jgi:hypothetical protein